MSSVIDGGRAPAAHTRARAAAHRSNPLQQLSIDRLEHRCVVVSDPRA
jgi:hypothetical protein